MPEHAIASSKGFAMIDCPRFVTILARFAALAVVCVAANAAEPSSTAPALHDIVLVRHGNYTPDPAIDEKIGPPLSPIGVAQARLAGARLRGELPQPGTLYVSPMQRARDTAAAIGAEFPGRAFEVVDDLAECTPPTRRADIMAKEKPEDLAACKARLDRVFATYFKPAQGSPRATCSSATAMSSATSSRARSASTRKRGWKCRSATRASRASASKPTAASR
jgi:hypothetical protein